MRTAAVYDIHGNLPALEAVLDEARSARVERLVVGGDVLPGPMPAECLAALEEFPARVRFLHGNGERDVLAAGAGEAPARVPDAFHPGLRWVASRLSAEALARVERWPATVRLELPDIGTTLFCHASPRDDNEIFTRLTPERRLRPLFEGLGADLVVCGHTHMQFDRRVEDVRLVNAGSVGMPFGRPGAHWLLLDETVEMRRTDYDLDAAVERIAATGYPDAAILALHRPAPAEEMEERFEAVALAASDGENER